MNSLFEYHRNCIIPFEASSVKPDGQRQKPSSQLDSLMHVSPFAHDSPGFAETNKGSITCWQNIKK